MKVFKIPSYGKSGWFKEHYRHYLAAKGITTNQYFARRGQVRPFEYLGRPITDLELAKWIAIAKHKEGLDRIDARSDHPEWSDEEYATYKDDILTRRAALNDRLLNDREYRDEIERMAGVAKLRGQYKEEQEGVVKFRDVLEPVGLLGGGLGSAQADVQQYLRSKGVFLEGEELAAAVAAYEQYAQAKEQYDVLNQEGTESFGQLAALEGQVEAAKEQLRSLGRADLAGDEFVVAQQELAKIKELKTLRQEDPRKLLEEMPEVVLTAKERMLEKVRSDESLMDFARQRINKELLPRTGEFVSDEEIPRWLEQHPDELSLIRSRRELRIAQLENAPLISFARRQSQERARQERKVVLEGVPEAVGAALARLNREQQRELLEKVDAYQLQLQAINAYERGTGGLMEDRRAELEAKAYADTLGTLGFQLPPAVFQEVAGGAFGRKGKGARSGVLPAEYVGAEGEKVVGPMFPFSELAGGKRTGRIQRETTPVPVRKYTPSAEAFAAQQAVKAEKMAAQVRALQEGAARARLAKKIEAGEEIELTEEEQARLNPK